MIGFGPSTPHVEEPRRLECILQSIKDLPGFSIEATEREATDAELERVHDPKMINFISKSWQSCADAGHVHTEVVPEVISSTTRHVFHFPSQIHLQTGFFCFDNATPIGEFTGVEARRSAAVAIDGAKKLLAGNNLVYSLCRPPGHHATISKYGGYSYYNNAALAADILKDSGFVTVLDIDYHHGNGTQDIFYDRNDVAYVSIHADPDFEYPFYSGAANELGHGVGLGYNLNLPLPKDTYYSAYLPALETAIQKIKDLSTKYLVLSFGADPAEGDPICTFHLTFDDFKDIGVRLRALGIPVLVVQEGGYSFDEILGESAKSLIKGLAGQ